MRKRCYKYKGMRIVRFVQIHCGTVAACVFSVPDVRNHFFAQAMAIFLDRGVNKQRNGTGGLRMESGMRSRMSKRRHSDTHEANESINLAVVGVGRSSPGNGSIWNAQRIAAKEMNPFLSARAFPGHNLPKESRMFPVI